MELKIHLMGICPSVHYKYDKFYECLLNEHYFYANSSVECEER
jgi:hypothetical protein